MKIDLTETTIHNFPHAFLSKRAEPILVQPLDDKRRPQLVEMYLAYEPRNSFGGLPPITDEACIRWVEQTIATGVNLTALSFDRGMVGHAALFPIDAESCEILVVVSPPEQRTGIGTELTRCLVQLAHELNYGSVRLNVDAQNHVARHVYEKCGFEYLSRALMGELDMSLDLQRYRASIEVPVREIMSTQVYCVRQDAACSEALAMILADGVATLPVVNDRDELVGILSETDLLIEANIHKKVGDVLTREVVSIQEGCTVARVIALFRSRKLRCIPVLDRHTKLVGVVCRREILAHYARGLHAGPPG